MILPLNRLCALSQMISDIIQSEIVASISILVTVHFIESYEWLSQLKHCVASIVSPFGR